MKFKRRYNKDAVFNGHKENIEQYGVSIVAVCSGFAYTIGMSMLGLPDLIISTEDVKLSHWILNHSFEYFKVNGFKRGINNDVATMPIRYDLIDIDQNLSDDYVCQTLSFYGENPFYVGENGVRFAQVIWQDEKGIFPDEVGYNKAFKQEVFKPLTLN